MAKVIHLVRHGHHGQLARLCGRMPGVEIDELGRRQMAECANWMARPDAIQSSPQLRATQSAAILAAHFNLPVEIVAAVDEIDVGEWTGLSFKNLDRDPHWRRWNEHRGANWPPSGESMTDLQRRVVRHLEQLRTDGTDQTVVIVSHAEPVRAALLYYARIALDDFLTIDIGLASVNTLVADRDGLRQVVDEQRVPT
jgi:broad specificity phosphatase PhoE